MNNDFLNTYELCHHGIKGQQWGVRRYQNPDGTFTPEGRRRYGLGDNSEKSTEDLRRDLNRASLEYRYATAMAKSKTKSQARSLAKNIFETVGKTLNTAAAYATTTANASNEASRLGSNIGDTALERRYSNLSESATDAAKNAKVGSQVSKMGKHIVELDSVDEIKLKKFKKDAAAFSDEELKRMVERAELERRYEDDVKNRKYAETMTNINLALTTVGSVVGIAAASLAIYTTLHQGQTTTNATIHQSIDTN